MKIFKRKKEHNAMDFGEIIIKIGNVCVLIGAAATIVCLVVFVTELAKRIS